MYTELCTRCPIRAHLRRGPVEITTIQIRNRLKNEMEGKKRFVAIASLAEELRQIMDELMKSSNTRVFENHEIVVNVQVPYCPNLDLLDLPGLVEVVPPSGEDVPKKTYDLAAKIIKEVF